MFRLSTSSPIIEDVEARLVVNRVNGYGLALGVFFCVGKLIYLLQKIELILRVHIQNLTVFRI